MLNAPPGLPFSVMQSKIPFECNKYLRRWDMFYICLFNCEWNIQRCRLQIKMSTVLYASRMTVLHHRKQYKNPFSVDCLCKSESKTLRLFQRSYFIVVQSFLQSLALWCWLWTTIMNNRINEISDYEMNCKGTALSFFLV